jgi:anti-sigma factor ChrR (cupin superfamily)
MDGLTAPLPVTPGADHAGLGPLQSRYVAVDGLPWMPTSVPGIDMKILMQQPEGGMLTALYRWAPGASLPLHEHVEIEQSYLLEGSLVDEEGEARTGDFVWRPRGNRHIAHSPGGALVLSFFLRPNRFL